MIIRANKERLSKVTHMYIADSLYAANPIMEICKKYKNTKNYEGKQVFTFWRW